MTPGTAFVLLGLGLGALVVANQGSPREAATSSSLHDRAIAAQRFSALASQRARELAAQWSAEQEARRAALDRTRST